MAQVEPGPFSEQEPTRIFRKSGGVCRGRTCDLLIKSQLLYQLS
jgi:hypothetical protein